jgi:hypothetical protein
MPNAIKYNTSAETLALKKGNFWIGTGDVGKGPTSSTGFYNGLTPPTGGYTIYLNKASGGPSIYTVTTEAQMVSLTNSIGSQSFTTSGQCLNWFATQTDKMIFNIDYPAIVTNGLVVNLDAGFTPSYPTTATTWYDVSSGVNNGTLTNGPTYSSANEGGIMFDGIDDYVNVSNNPITGSTPSTVEFWMIPSVVTNQSVGECFLQIGASTTNQMRLYFFRDAKFAVAYYSNDFTFNYTAIANTTYNAVFTENGSGVVQLYINGVFQNSGSLSPPNTSSTGYTIARYTGGGPNFNGKMFLQRTYNRVLSASEVLQNYNAQKSRFGL